MTFHLSVLTFLYADPHYVPHRLHMPLHDPVISCKSRGSYGAHVLYNVADVSKHFAPIVNYGLGSIIWYLSCNYLLFPGHKTTSKQLLCFVLDIVVCYLLSYYLIGPYVSRLLLRSHSVTRFFSFGGTENIRGNCEMSVGSLSYALLNYFGQRYFVFSDRFAARKDRNTEE